MQQTTQRFPLNPTTRWVLPGAAAVALVGAALANASRARLSYLCAALVVAALWAIARLFRPTLVVGAEGYRVEVRGREQLRVAFTEVKRARAVPAERAMYLDCGDPRRNLLLPTHHGFGFRFARQAELYVLLAQRLADRLEIADKLIADEDKP